MKYTLIFLFILMTQLSSFPLLANESQIESLEIKKDRRIDFSPPKDLKGPVFPIEELIEEPSQDTNLFLSEFIKMTATLVLIIALIFIFAWFLKRMVNTRIEQANSTSLIQVVERRTISQKTSVYLLNVEGKGIVMAESPSGITFLGNYPIDKTFNL